ncbi:MAG: DEAD/DEAH box helicase [Armatimonadetes bacterium]|nr:DEAD/DEAH box helicase [Armatimonadota bacterium]
MRCCVVDASVPRWSDTPLTLHKALTDRLAETGIDRFYEHQAEAIAASTAGQDVMVVTGTGSGKTLCYNVPVIESCLSEPKARALYLFPTKALAQDQAQKLTALLPEGLTCGTYDGDTNQASRSLIRKRAHIVLTNPDMLHVGVLPHHENWKDVLKSLRYIVVDEAHVYRGVFGSHVGGVLRRLLRLCEWYRSRPQVMACSATIANPGELFGKLTGRTPVLVRDDSAAKGRRHVVLVAPPETEEGFSPNRDAASLLAEFVSNGLRTLAFSRARTTTELVVRQARAILEKQGGDPSWVDSYRGGYTPKERRDIEKALFSGRLRGLSTTNAMELGVDVGGLDAVVLNGYPGTVSSFWQQVGRAGRGARDSLAVMLAHADPLEQFLVRSPDLLLDKPVESAVLDPENPDVLQRQLLCAAHERPIGEEELTRFGPGASDAVAALVADGSCRWSAGRLFFASYESPAMSTDIRGSGSEKVLILEGASPLAEMEEWRAPQQAHEGAVYLHRGRSYIVEALDLERRVARVRAEEPDYFTQAIVQSLVESTVPIEVDGDWTLCGVRVTTHVPSYVRKRSDGDGVLDETPLDLPPRTKDTVGVRWDLAGLTVEQAGVVHALEHALLSVAPVIAGCDRNDLGSCWYVLCPDTMAPALYVFDAVPGGVGLAARLFHERRAWLEQASTLLRSCSCADGCPACLLVSQCESGNDPLDKPGAFGILTSELER